MPQITLDGYPLNVQRYTLSRETKFKQYNIANTDLDTGLFLASNNRIHHLEFNTITNQDTETILSLLQKTQNSLVDESGFQYNVTVRSIKNTLEGGKSGFYEFIVEFIDDGNLPIQTTPPITNTNILVDTGTLQFAGQGNQLVYLYGMYWAFYTKISGSGNVVGYKTSVDGLNWSSFNLILGETLGEVVVLSIVNGNIYYIDEKSQCFFRYGSLALDGTINWAIPSTSTGILFSPFSITTDNNNNIYIGTEDSTNMQVITNRTGTWGYDLNVNVGGLVEETIVIPLTKGKMAAFGDGGFFYIYNGTSWIQSTSLSSGAFSVIYSDFISIGDDVYGNIFEGQGGLFSRYSYNSNTWSPIISLFINYPLTINNAGNKLIAGVGQGSSSLESISYRISQDLGSNWGPSSTLVSNFSFSIPLTSFYQNGTLAFLWNQGGGSPGNLYFESISA